ncbi:MAG: DUF5684 domain-containing protein [bacterium]|nr:DUF5684 domain-containing protein [bacterium]
MVVYREVLTSFYTFIIVALWVLTIIGKWKMFEKAGEPGWASIIPFYADYKLYQMAWGNGWLFLLALVPVVNIVVAAIVCWKLAQAFGKGVGFAIGMFLIPSLFYMILGFDASQYLGVQD